MRFLLAVCVALLLWPILAVPFCVAAVERSPATLSNEAAMPAPKLTSPKMLPLTPDEERVIWGKGTERPYSGIYLNNKIAGTYVCRACGAPLYRSADKFDSACGWPSFDDEIAGAVRRKPDPDGQRVEILCANCGGHLGHVFSGEGFTPKNLRHCVNSRSLFFVREGDPLPPASKDGRADMSNAVVRPTRGKAQAIFAGGCFWGVEHVFSQLPGVLDVVSGYTGGHTENPTYEQVCSGDTGHAEAVLITYNPEQVSYEALARLFFELHDPTEVMRQGPDVGSQYRSAVFYLDEAQEKTAEKLVGLLLDNGYAVATEVTAAGPFYPAEDYHQDYILKHPELLCHVPVKRFEKKAGH